MGAEAFAGAMSAGLDPMRVVVAKAAVRTARVMGLDLRRRLERRRARRDGLLLLESSSSPSSLPSFRANRRGCCLVLEVDGSGNDV